MDSNIIRSFSHNVNEEDEPNEVCLSQRMTRKSESYNDSRDWEDIVTCSIHLGIMEDPRRLSCQHCFCYKCLKEYYRQYQELICPICRAKETIFNIDNLPSALTEKQVIDVLMKHKHRRNTNETGNTLQYDIKTEMNKTNILNDNKVIFTIPNENEDCSENSPECSKSALSKSNTDNSRMSVSGSIYEMIDIEMMRESMLKHSHYKVVNKGSVQKCYKQLYQFKKENINSDFSIFDIYISDSPKRSSKFLLVNVNNSEMVIFSDCQIQKFSIYVEGKLFKPHYLRFFKGDVIVSGSFEKENMMMSVFLQCNLKGEILHQSEFYAWPDSCPGPVMLGFDIDCKVDKFYLCMPQPQKILVYNSKMSECTEIAEFNDCQPEYVAFYSIHNQLFISCPLNKRIIILDIDSRIYRLFNTEKINKAIPKMIFVTDDEKIIFLDINRNKFIWIKKRHEYILTQNLNIPLIYKDCAIKSFQVIPCSMIVVGFQKEILIFQSAKYFSKLRRFMDLCHTL